MIDSALANNTTTVLCRVTQYMPDDVSQSLGYFFHKLRYETDASDVYQDMEDKLDNFLVIDARSVDAYAYEHIPKAISVPHKTVSAATTSILPSDKLLVVFGDGIGCNASTKRAAKLTALGFKVKELLADSTGGKEMAIR